MATIRDEEIEIVFEDIEYIPGYKEAEIERRTNELERISNEEKRQTLYNQMQDDYDKGRFNGATFTPTVDSECNIIWTNDKGLPNPETVNVKGDKGDTGSTGPQGVQGEPGYTPVRTVDYWTASDVSAMESHCDTYIDSKIGYINEALASLTTVGGGN